MNPALAAFLLTYPFIAYAIFALWRHDVRVYPDDMPRGGVKVMLVVSFAWPIVLVLIVVALVIYAVNEVL